MITEKNVLVTGGAGSVGPRLVRRLLKLDPNVVRVFDQSEPAFAAFKSELNDRRCRFLSEDICDKGRLARAVDGIGIVIHTAGMKRDINDTVFFVNFSHSLQAIINRRNQTINKLSLCIYNHRYK